MNKVIKAEAKALRRYDSDQLINLISKISAWRRSDEASFTKALTKEGVKIEPIMGSMATAIERIGEAVPNALEKFMEKWWERREGKEGEKS